MDVVGSGGVFLVQLIGIFGVVCVGAGRVGGSRLRRIEQDMSITR